MPAVLIWTGKVGSGFVRRNYAIINIITERMMIMKLKHSLLAVTFGAALTFGSIFGAQAFFNSPLAATVITGPSTSAWATKCTSTSVP